MKNNGAVTLNGGFITFFDDWRDLTHFPVLRVHAIV